MLKIKFYQKNDLDSWNSFNRKSKNGLFLFDRNYLDYHSDRFMDSSVMVYDEAELIGLLPANKDGKNLYSHGGITFGGFVVSSKMSTVRMITMLSALIDFFKRHEIEKIFYKAIPYVYHKLEAQEDLYALTAAGAQLYRRDLSSIIRLNSRLPFSKSKKCGVNKAKKSGVSVRLTSDFAAFMPILTAVIAEHGATPTHSLDEIVLLASRFPDHIKLYCAYEGENMVGGIVIYEYDKVVHTQYMAASSRGKEIGALDLIIKELVETTYRTFDYLSFGISTENNGKYLNHGLVSQKEMFGARAIVHDFYQLDLC